MSAALTLADAPTSQCCTTEARHIVRLREDERFCASYCGDSRHLTICPLGIGGPDHTPDVRLAVVR